MRINRQYIFFSILLIFIMGNILKPQLAFQISPTLDDACYFNNALKIVGLTYDRCKSNSYAPGQSLLFMPVVVAAFTIEKISSVEFEKLATLLMGIQTLISYLLLQILLWRWIQDEHNNNKSTSKPPLFIAFFVGLGFPFLFYATSETILPTINEALLTLLFLRACRHKAAYWALLYAGTLCLVRWNALPIFLVWVAFFYKNKKATLLAAITALCLSIPTAFIAKNGYNSDTLADIVMNISLLRLHRVFWGSDWGLVWTVPLWLLLIASGIKNLRSNAFIHTSALLYIFIQLALVIGWNGNGGFFHYRYLASSFILALLFWPSFWSELRGPGKIAIAALIVVQGVWMTTTTGFYEYTERLAPLLTSDLHAYAKDYQLRVLEEVKNKVNF